MSIDFRSKKAEHHRQVDEIQASVKNLDSMTKAQIKSFASDIGLTVSSTLTKANMITAVTETSEFVDSEKERKINELRVATDTLYGLQR